jgi:hypothetical protein
VEKTKYEALVDEEGEGSGATIPKAIGFALNTL